MRLPPRYPDSFCSFNSSGLARLFNKYGVALYLGGHGHSCA